MIEDKIPKDPLRQLSLSEYVDDGDWLEVVRTVSRAEEDLKERKRLRGGSPSGLIRGEK